MNNIKLHKILQDLHYIFITKLRFHIHLRGIIFDVDVMIGGLAKQF